MAVKDGVMALALAVIALSLGGCGSSGTGNAPSPPAPTPAPPADFVSQSVEGTLQGSATFDGIEVDIPPQPFAIYIDADKMNVAAQGHGNFDQLGMNASVYAQAVVNVGEKRITYFINGTLPPPLPSKLNNCSYINVTSMPDPKTVSSALKMILQAQPAIKAADGNKELDLSMDLSDLPDPIPKEAAGKVAVAVELGDDNVFRKVSKFDLELTKPIKESTKATMETTSTTAGAPNATRFVVDKSWGNCTEKKLGDMYEDFAQLPSTLRLPFQMMFKLLQIKPESTTEKQSNLVV